MKVIFKLIFIHTCSCSAASFFVLSSSSLSDESDDDETEISNFSAARRRFFLFFSRFGFSGAGRASLVGAGATATGLGSSGILAYLRMQDRNLCDEKKKWYLDIFPKNDIILDSEKVFVL